MAGKKEIKKSTGKTKLSKEERSKLASEAATRRWAKKKEAAVAVQTAEKMIEAVGPIAEDIAARLSESEESKTITASISKSMDEVVAVTQAPAPSKPKRRKPVPKAFGAASSYAEKRLAEAIKERAEAMGKTAMLNAEIPSLVQIIRALGGQLPIDSQALMPQAPVRYDLGTIMSDQPLPIGELPHTPSVNKSVGGGAIGGVNLEDEEDEDMHLRDSTVSAEEWH